MELAVVITTTASKEDAARLARLCVEERLAACAQILGIESVYRWEGIQQSAEWRLELKTAASRTADLMKRLAAAHPYDEPELIVMPVLEASDSYKAWVGTETS